MKTNKNIQHNIDATFDALDSVKEVDVPPFFKEKVMKRLFSQEKEEKYIWFWFTPKFQLATLVCVIVLNLVAFTELQADAYNDNVRSFGTTYGLQSDAENSIFD
ncbi:MAG: hypothetical protein ACJAV9_000108 [Urechidicola sp.]|jgi:hypothetical protein